MGGGPPAGQWSETPLDATASRVSPTIIGQSSVSISKGREYGWIVAATSRHRLAHGLTAALLAVSTGAGLATAGAAPSYAAAPRNPCQPGSTKISWSHISKPWAVDHTKQVVNQTPGTVTDSVTTTSQEVVAGPGRHARRRAAPAPPPARHLAGLHEYLHHRTGGMIGSLSHLIRGAAIEAILDGSEQVTRKLLDTIDLDHAAQSSTARRPRRRA